MKKSKFFAAALAATMFATAACGLIACDKDAGEIPTGTTKPPVSQGTEYTVTFSGTNVTKTTSGGKLSGTMPTAAAPSGKEFKGWSKTQNATTPDITASNYNSYPFSGTTTTVTLYPVFGQVQGGNNQSDEYTITLDATTNGGSCSTSSLTTVNQKLSSLPDATRGTDTFNGWFTAATGGTQVTTSTPFDGTVTTIYAQFTQQQQGNTNADGIYVGGQLVAEFVKSGDGEAEYDAEKEYKASGVTLNAGDEVIIKIDGQQLTHTAGVLELWLASELNPHGVYLDQSTGIFKIKAAGGTRAFTINARYYTEENVCWSIEFTDGLTDSLQVGGAYLVGEGFENASWNLSTDLYIDPVDGLTVTFTANSKFKVCGCKSEDPSAGRDWIYNEGKFYREEGGSNLSLSGIDGSNNGSASGTHTYKITLEDGIVVFTLVS